MHEYNDAATKDTSIIFNQKSVPSVEINPKCGDCQFHT